MLVIAGGMNIMYPFINFLGTHYPFNLVIWSYAAINVYKYVFNILVLIISFLRSKLDFVKMNWNDSIFTTNQTLRELPRSNVTKTAF